MCRGKGREARDENDWPRMLVLAQQKMWISGIDELFVTRRSILVPRLYSKSPFEAFWKVWLACSTRKVLLSATLNSGR